jgi:hypothetical protein
MEAESEFMTYTTNLMSSNTRACTKFRGRGMTITTTVSFTDNLTRNSTTIKTTPNPLTGNPNTTPTLNHSTTSPHRNFINLNSSNRIPATPFCRTHPHPLKRCHKCKYPLNHRTVNCDKCTFTQSVPGNTQVYICCMCN